VLVVGVSLGRKCAVKDGAMKWDESKTREQWPNLKAPLEDRWKRGHVDCAFLSSFKAR